MQIYLFQCDACQEPFEKAMGMNDKHEANCPKCGKPARRVFTKAEMKKNSGFYSEELGREVGSHAEYNLLKEKQRYMQGLNPYLENNAKPKDEWVEEKHRADTKRRAEADREEAELAEDYPEYYDEVTTYE